MRSRRARPRSPGARSPRSPGEAEAHFSELRGAVGFRSVIEVDQSPIGRTPRSSPATYLGIFDLIRKFFATLPESKIRGYTASRFSFNTVGGRCPTCEGAGRIRLEMAFMPDTYLPCDDCSGPQVRARKALRDVTWKGLSIGAVLRLDIPEGGGRLLQLPLRALAGVPADGGLPRARLPDARPKLPDAFRRRGPAAEKLVTESSRRALPPTAEGEAGDPCPATCTSSRSPHDRASLKRLQKS